MKLNGKQTAVLDEIARRVEETCMKCSLKDACPNQGKGFEKIINCAMERYVRKSVKADAKS